MIWDFIYKYYVGPTLNGEPYTIVDTLTYALILILAVYLVYRWLKKTGIDIDQEFIVSTIPFVVLGGLLRVVEDTGIIPRPWNVILVTPVIFFVVFFITVTLLVIARTLEKNGLIASYTRGYAAGGICACIITAAVLVYFGITETRIALGVLVTILAMAAVSSAAVWSLLRYGLKWSFADDILYKLLIFGHMLDASATSFGIDLHELTYVEVHVVGSHLIEATGTAFSMFALKLAVIIPAIYVLEMYRKEGNSQLWHLIILAMIVVGMAPGIRDMVRMILYV
ncbi:DUF63 family protein [Methanogenium organophilum]|uniref:DUF63 family protein n=1 Tax=Methanogenium organophilum TaxID=2199 RepID=A0A9X9S2N8_METOG|nr:DUF63 family protein [Methanogenium organophilum]WAI00769.1 DUF63 family protein [Methanogenium organophilum]